MSKEIFVSRHLQLYKLEHEKAMEDIPNYLGNPINAFTLIKRLTTDLDDIDDSIKVGTGSYYSFPVAFFIISQRLKGLKICVYSDDFMSN